MAELVASDDIYLEPAEEVPEITILSEANETKLSKQKHVLDPPPEPPKKPNGLIGIEDDTSFGFTLPTEVNVQAFSLPRTHIDTNFTMNYLEDSDAIPVYRALPKYPKEAAELDLDGWVKLRFAIDRYGKVVDIEVLESLPSAIFNESAIEVLGRWKYKPKVKDGKTVKQYNLSVRIDFAKSR